jgi:hypothetical protein
MWLFEHLIQSDPDGVAAHTWPGQVMGVVTSALGILIFGTVLGLIFRRANTWLRADSNDAIREFNRRHTNRVATASTAPSQAPAARIERIKVLAVAVFGSAVAISILGAGIAVASRMRVGQTDL